VRNCGLGRLVCRKSCQRSSRGGQHDARETTEVSPQCSRTCLEMKTHSCTAIGKSGPSGAQISACCACRWLHIVCARNAATKCRTTSTNFASQNRAIPVSRLQARYRARLYGDGFVTCTLVYGGMVRGAWKRPGRHARTLVLPLHEFEISNTGQRLAVNLAAALAVAQEDL
jgi:hypothetical protein